VSISSHLPFVLVVGAADTGRAPMLVALLRRRIDRRGLSLRIESAGVVGHDGDPAEPEARDAMLALNLDIADHRARLLDDTLIEAADLLLTVDTGVARVLRSRDPDLPVAALGELSASRRDVPDPFRMQVGAWIHYAHEIDRLIGAGLDQLLARLDQSELAASEGPVQSVDPVEPDVAITHSEKLPSVPTPERGTAIARCERLLQVLAEMPEVIDWQAAQQRLARELEIAALPQSSADLSEAFVALLRSVLALRTSAPNAEQSALLRAAVLRLYEPVDQPALSRLSSELPRLTGSSQ
jgi:protein-tyrosine phosphatase